MYFELCIIADIQKFDYAKTIILGKYASIRLFFERVHLKIDKKMF